MIRSNMLVLNYFMNIIVCVGIGFKIYRPSSENEFCRDDV